MFQLVYASTAKKLFSGNELSERIAHYREKNLRLGITGLLLYKHGSFMQVLEGGEETVRGLFATIRGDPRHHHVRLLMALPVTERRFPNWPMGFKGLDEMDAGAGPRGPNRQARPAGR